jgi:hypothetical protein
MKTMFRAICAAALFVAIGACKTEGADAGAPMTGESGGMCGGIAAIGCKSEGDYCAYEPGHCVEIADAAGVCKERPGMCAMDYTPVCGCDGNTYSNACSAAAKGVSVASSGECPPPEDQD